MFFVIKLLLKFVVKLNFLNFSFITEFDFNFQYLEINCW
jgi:hypothetical protein